MYKFAEKIIVKVKEKVGENVQVQIKKVEKNNNRCRIAITARYPDVNVGPCIYLEDYYAQYQNGQMTEEEIINAIFQVILEQKQEVTDLDVTSVFEWDKVKEYLAGQLVNLEWNQEWLSNKPHREILDFAMLYYLNKEIIDGINGNIVIDNTLLEMWGKSEEDLYEAAVINMKKEIVWENIGNILQDESADAEITCMEDSMYVLTNKEHCYGAAMIIDNNMLTNISQFIGDFVLLPSSVHEWLLLPDDGMVDYKGLLKMVCEVNEEIVRPEERLSDHVYVYKRDVRNVKRVA